jgi:hypothetical protein
VPKGAFCSGTPTKVPFIGIQWLGDHTTKAEKSGEKKCPKQGEQARPLLTLRCKVDLRRASHFSIAIFWF